MARARLGEPPPGEGGEDHNLGFHYPDWAQLAIRFFGLTR
jgi:hypothetical protein